MITAEPICVFQWIQTKIILSTSAMSRLHIKRRYYGDTKIAAAGFKYSAHSNAPAQVLTSKNVPVFVGELRRFHRWLINSHIWSLQLTGVRRESKRPVEGAKTKTTTFFCLDFYVVGYNFSGLNYDPLWVKHVFFLSQQCLLI